VFHSGGVSRVEDHFESPSRRSTPHRQSRVVFQMCLAKAVQCRRFFASETWRTRQRLFRDFTTCNPNLFYKRGCNVIRVNRLKQAIVSAIVQSGYQDSLFLPYNLSDNSGFVCCSVAFSNLNFSCNFWCL